LLLADCHRQVAEALAADKFDQMLMRKEYEYSMNVLAFGIQSSDITPAFPYVAPFSCTVPDICRIVRSFNEDSVSFMAHGGGGDTYAAVKKYLGRILSELRDASIQKLVDSGGALSVSQAMQVAANMSVMERECEFFTRHATQLCGVPLRAMERGRRDFPLRISRDAAEALLLRLLRAKADEFMRQTDGVNWMADDPPPGGNEYANEFIIYLETLQLRSRFFLYRCSVTYFWQCLSTSLSESLISSRGLVWEAQSPPSSCPFPGGCWSTGLPLFLGLAS
jgi:exocyst complex component 6